MSQEPDQPKLPRPVWEEQQQQSTDLSQPRASPTRNAREERLHALRQQRQQSDRFPLPSRYQRQGVPAPPPRRPSFKALLKHMWEHGPFASPTPRAPAPPAPPPKIPARTGEERPLETRARAWIERSQPKVASLIEQAQKKMQQAQTWLSAQAEKRRDPAQHNQAVPGLIVVGFEQTISRDEAVQRIAALGGKALRHKPAVNQYQVAVPPGQEETLVAHFRQVPGVIRADLERPTGQ
jgi:hypothetical protein